MAFCEVGKPAPEFSLACIQAEQSAPRRASLADYAGRWLVLVFYPRDFSFVCPTELTLFSAHLCDFATRDCDVLGISVDSIQTHREWLATPPSEGGLGPLRFPLASDPDGEASRAYGVWVEEKELSTRGLFVIDPDGVLQYTVKHNLSVGRRPDVVLRVLDALRSGGLCPANWTSADGNIDPEKVLRPGRTLGRYRIREAVGSGSFGTVFAAWDLRLERMVALKVLKRNVFDSRDVVLAEARAAAALNSPHVCTIYAVDEEDGLPVIAMEYLDGMPLSDLVAQGLDRPAVVRLARQIASGLVDAHQYGVVHGDLKPANVLVTSRGVAKIVDFGLGQRLPPRRLPREKRTRTRPPRRKTGADTERIEATVDFVAPAGEGMIRGTPALHGRPNRPAPNQPLGQATSTPSDSCSTKCSPDVRPIPIGPSSIRSSPSAPRTSAPNWPSRSDEPFQGLLLAMLSRDATRRPTIPEVERQLAELAR